MKGRFASTNKLVAFIKAQAWLESNDIMEAAKHFAYIISQLPEPAREEHVAMSVIKEALRTQDFDALTKEVLTVLEKALVSVDDLRLKEAFSYLHNLIDQKESFQEKDYKIFTSFSAHFMRVQPRPLDNRSGSLAILSDEERIGISDDWQHKVNILSNLFENITLPIANVKEFLADMKETLQEMVDDDIESVRAAILEEAILSEAELKDNLDILKRAYVFHLLSDVGTNPEHIFTWSANGKLEIMRTLCDCIFQENAYNQFWLKLKNSVALQVSNFRVVGKFRYLLGGALADDLYVEVAKQIEVGKLTAYLNIILGTTERQYQSLIQRVLRELSERIYKERMTGENLIHYVKALKDAARIDTRFSKNKKLCADFLIQIKKAEKANYKAAKKEYKEIKRHLKQEKKAQKEQEKKMASKEKRHKKYGKQSVLDRPKSQENTEKKNNKELERNVDREHHRSLYEIKGKEKIKLVMPKENKQRIRPSKELNHNSVFSIFKRTGSSRDLTPAIKSPRKGEERDRSEQLRNLRLFGKFSPEKSEKPSEIGESRIRNTPRGDQGRGSHIGRHISHAEQSESRVMSKTPRAGDLREQFKNSGKLLTFHSDTVFELDRRGGPGGPGVT